MGTIPSSALAFLTLYLQLLGMSDFHASVCTALFLAGQVRDTATGRVLLGRILS